MRAGFSGKEYRTGPLLQLVQTVKVPIARCIYQDLVLFKCNDQYYLYRYAHMRVSDDKFKFAANLHVTTLIVVQQT